MPVSVMDFLCIYSAPGSEAAHKRSSFGLIRAVLAYPFDYCAAYGSLPIGTNKFSQVSTLLSLDIIADLAVMEQQ